MQNVNNNISFSGFRTKTLTNTQQQAVKAFISKEENIKMINKLDKFDIDVVAGVNGRMHVIVDFVHKSLGNLNIFGLKSMNEMDFETKPNLIAYRVPKTIKNMNEFIAKRDMQNKKCQFLK